MYICKTLKNTLDNALSLENAPDLEDAPDLNPKENTWSKSIF